MLSDMNSLNSGNIAPLLLQSSPLPQSALDLVNSDPMKRLTGPDQSTILAANP